MSALVKGVGRALVPPGIEPDLWWRLVVSGVLSFLFLAFLWSVGAFAALGFPGLARADKLAEIERKQDMQLRITLAQEVCRLYFLRMDASGQLWAQLNDTFDKRQEEYAAVNNGQRYPTSECSRPSQ